MVTTGLVGALFWLGSGAVPTPRSAVRFDVLLPDGLQFVGVPGGGDTANSGTVSPDGTRLVFVAADADGVSRLYVRDLRDTTARMLAGTERASMPFWSPDGRAIAYFAEGRLRRIDVAGGPPRTICDAGGSGGGSWGTSGVILFHGDAGLLRVAAEGGTPSPATTVDETRDDFARHRWPHFLPDGRRFLFVARSGGSVEGASRVLVGTLDSTDVRPLLETDSAAVFAPPDQLLFARERTLLAQRFDVDRLELLGEPMAVAGNIPTQLGLPAYSASNTGVLTYRTLRRQTSQASWFDREGRLLNSVGPVADILDLALSPDETNLAVTNRQDGNIWVLSLADGQYRRITFEGGTGGVTWSPDGTQLAYSSTGRDGTPGLHLFVRGATGAQPERLVHRRPLAGGTLAQWFPDGTRLLFFGVNPKTGLDLGVVGVQRDGPVTWPVQSEYTEMRPSLSPDGRWVAYLSDSRGRSFEVYVQPFPPDGSIWQVSSAGGAQVAWRRDGRELYYLTADRKLFAVEVSTGSGFRFGAPRFLFEMPVNTTGNIRNSFVPAADGQRFLVSRLIADEPPKITVVLNWQDVLETR